MKTVLLLKWDNGVRETRAMPRDGSPIYVGEGQEDTPIDLYDRGDRVATLVFRGDAQSRCAFLVAELPDDVACDQCDHPDENCERFVHGVADYIAAYEVVIRRVCKLRDPSQAAPGILQTIDDAIIGLGRMRDAAAEIVAILTERHRHRGQA